MTTWTGAGHTGQGQLPTTDEHDHSRDRSCIADRAPVSCRVGGPHRSIERYRTQCSCWGSTDLLAGIDRPRISRFGTCACRALRADAGRRYNTWRSHRRAPTVRSRRLNTVLATALGAMVAFGLAAAAQAFTGFGSALVAVPLVAVLTDPVTAIVSTTCVSVGISAYGTIKEHRSIERSNAKRLIISGLVGIPIGALALHYLDVNALNLVIGCVLLGAVTLSLLGVEVRNSPRSEITGGIIGGALLTSTGMNGPPIVLVTYGSSKSAVTKRATLQIVFLAHDLIAIVFFSVMELIDVEVLGLSVVGLIVTPGGWALGNSIFARLSARSFRIASTAILAAVALVAVVGGIAAYS